MKMGRFGERKKIMVVFGTRPEAIKLAPVIKKIDEYRDKLLAVICVTAQHRQMLDQALRVFNIKPQYDLNIMEDNQTLSDTVSKSISKLRLIIDKVRPDMVLVQGDTNTTFAASLAAFYSKIPVGYVEAGLRTSDKYNPFPEEVNRRLTSVIVDLYFAPTRTAKDNLLKEGTREDKIFITGNPIIDALFMIGGGNSNILEKLHIDRKKKIILITAHRREKFGSPFRQVCYALKEIVNKNSNVELVFPVHLNPYVQKIVRQILKETERIHLIKPLDYVSFIALLKKSYLVITDSGGIQEEAAALGKPAVVIRNTTERPEGIIEGQAIIGGEDKDKILNTVSMILNHKKVYNKMSRASKIYGDGQAAERIVKTILSYFKLGRLPEEFLYKYRKGK